MDSRFHERLESNVALINRRLDATIRGSAAPHARLFEAMRYSLLSGGKRIRACLTIEFSRLFGGEDLPAIQLGCAVELLHAYSLIHDDLPCMDDDDFRRGKPSNHKVYGEWLALLAGDALQAAAFEMAACAELEPARVVRALTVLSRAAGTQGICGGQYLDLAGEGSARSLAEVTRLHEMKTAALMVAACEMGSISAGIEGIEPAQSYGRHLGLAFQVRDDMLNVAGDAEKLGKPIGTDADRQKCTFVTLYGMERCREIVEEETEAAVAAVSSLDRADFLCALARSLAARDK